MKRLLPLLLAATFSAAVASPTSPVVVAGQATFNQQGNVFTITNTPNTVINWQSFSVAPGKVTRFVQQSASSAVLNRILGQDPTQILGALQSNGQVFLINPNGVMFGKDSRIDVAGLTASTLNLSDADFLAGRRNFSAGPAAGNISNQGAISAQPGGHVFLVAPNVENTGIITAPNGDVVLAAGRQVQLVDSRDPDMHVVVSAPEDKAVNLGQVISQGGRIGIYGALVRQRGEVNANSAVVGQNGKIVLKASGDTLLEEGSKTTATGAGNGGSVHVLGNRVAMTGNAQVDVSGGANGGTVLMGGDYKGSNPLYASAQQTWMGKDASIKADAGNAGKGGKVILWATDATRAFGTISARGGAVSGDGGFIETSADYLDVNGLRVDTRALNGKNGVWLLDPLNITVGLPNCSGGDTCFSAADARVFANVPDVTGLISVSTLLGAGSDIILQAKNNIRFNDAITTGATSITANAGNSIYVDAPLTTTGGEIRLIANDPMSGTPSGNGGVYVNNHLRSNGGEITLAGKELTLASTGSIDSGAANVNFTVDRLTLGSYVNAGPVTGSNLVTIMPYSAGRPIVMGNSPSSNLGALYLTNGELGNLHASQIRIGDATNTSSITWEWPGVYSSAGTRTLSLRTSGLIKVNNLIELQDPASHLELHSGSLDITGSGSLKAANVTLRSDAMNISGAVRATEQIRLVADDALSHIAVGDGAEGSLTIQNAELALLSAPKVQIGEASASGGITVGTVNYAPATANQLTIESGSGMYVDGAVTTNGALSLNASALNISSTGSVTAPNVTLRADAMDIGGNVNGASSIKLMSKDGWQAITVGSLLMGIEGALTIDDLELAKLASPNLYIGDSAQSGSIHLGALSYAGNMTVNAGTAQLAVDGAVVATGSLSLESENDLAVSSTGSVEAANVTLRADRMAIGGGVKGTSAIKVLAGSTTQHIQLGGTPGTDYSLKLDNTELALLVSPNLYIGDSAMTGGVNIDDMTYTHAGAGKLTVDAGTTNIHVDGYATTSGALVLKAGTGIYQAAPTGTESVAITTPHLQLVGNGSADANFNLTNGVNMIDMLTGTGLRDLHVLNGKDLTIGDGTTGLQYADGLDYNGLRIALTNSSKLTIKDSIYTNDGHIDIEAGSVQIGLPLDSVGNSSGTTTATLQASSVRMELHGADGISLSKGSLIASSYVELETDKFQLEQGAQITSPSVSGHFNIAPYSDMVRIELGSGAVDNSTTGLVTLGLSEIELQAIDTSYISIGDYVEGQPGQVSVIGSLNLSAAPRLESLNIFLGTAGMDIRSGASLIGTRSVNIQSVSASTRAGDVIVNGLLEARKTERMSDETVHSVGNVWIESKAVRGTGLIKAGFVSLDATEGIGTSEVPLDLQVFGLWAQNTQYGTVGAPINLRNNYNAGTPNHLMVGGLHQYGDGVGSISLETWGGMTIADQNSSSEPATATASTTTSTSTPEPTVHTRSGAISLVTHSPLNVEGIVESTSGSISLKATDGGTLTVTSTGKVQSETGNITLEAATLNVPTGSVSTGGTVTLTGTVTPTGPTLTECLATPAMTGCATVLNMALDACIADKTGSYCSQVLPTMTMCIADETRKGCSVVLPTLEQCLANRTAEGCSVVLPTTAECAATPSLPGCVASGPTLEQCIANPSISGCSSVLPPLAVCIANKATPGCEAVLPSLSVCIADKSTAGCEAVLPDLAQCIADKTAPGCGVVLPSLEVCIANKATAGCEAVLPNLAACVADKSLPGCQVVLPNLAACIADKTAPGCDTVLPNLASCIADKTTPGCEVILPNLTACIADKTAPGCEVVLPTIAACVANKSTAGCEVVLPNLAACIANKATAGCEVVLPTIAVCVANKATAGCEVVLPNLAACIADKATAGCEVVLPNLAACVADKTTAGCEVVLPTLAACIANKATAGCEAVLPNLAACVANKATPGCEVVLPNLAACVADKTTDGCEAVLPTMAACIADKATAGCEVILPPLAVCIANSAAPGCEAVLPTIAQCVVNPTLGGCDVVLPSLAQCISDKTQPGCVVVLPTLAECIGSPSLGGCSVILPKLEQCAVNPNLPGCEAVLPKPDFCATHPSDPTCQIFSPGSGQQGGQEKAPVTEAVQTSVTLVSKTPQPQTGARSSPTSTGTSSGTEQSQGQQQGEPEKQAEKEQGTAPADNSGVKNEKPATKLYCN